MTTNIEKVTQISDEKLLEVGHDGNIMGTLRKLNCTNDPRARAILIQRFKELGIKRNQYNRTEYTIDDIKKVVSKSYCMNDVIKGLGLSVHGWHHTRIKQLLNENNIDYSHFDISKTKQRGKRIWSQEEIFCENSLYHRSMVRNAVIRFNIIEDYKCSNCGITEWFNNTLVLELDHINGINTDNRPKNLRWLCPNCHSLTDTYKNRPGKNNGVVAKEV